MKRERIHKHLPQIAEAVGLAAVVYGVAIFSVSLAFVIFGLALIAGAILYERGQGESS